MGLALIFESPPDARHWARCFHKVILPDLESVSEIIFPVFLPCVSVKLHCILSHSQLPWRCLHALPGSKAPAQLLPCGANTWIPKNILLTWGIKFQVLFITEKKEAVVTFRPKFVSEASLGWPGAGVYKKIDSQGNEDTTEKKFPPLLMVHLFSYLLGALTSQVVRIPVMLYEPSVVISSLMVMRIEISCLS